MIFSEIFETNSFLKEILTTVNWPLLIFALVFAYLSTIPSFFEQILKFLKRKSLMKVLPGPCGYPIVGCAFSIDRLRPYKSFETWAKKYGPVFKVKVFNKYIVVLSDIQVVREALVEKSMDFAGRPPQFYRAKFMADGHKDIVSASPCSLWLLLRKAVHREVKKYDPSTVRLEELTFRVIDDLLEELKSSKEKPFNPREALFNGIVNTNCLLLIGEKLNKNDQKMAMMKKLISLVTRAMCMGGRGSELDQFPWLRFFGNSTYKELILAKKLRDEIYDWMKQKVDYDLKENTGIYGVVHAFQKLTEVPNEKVDATNVKLAIVNLIIGGSSASHHYLYLMIHILAQHKQLQDNVFEEVYRVVGKDRKPSVADKEKMHFSRAFVLEMFRFGSISPILIPHYTTKDTSVGTYQIPADTTVIATSRSIHHDASFWKDPYNFDPERFLNNETKELLPPSHENMKRLISFGGGLRGCPGEAFAKSRLFLFLTGIIQKFEIEKDSEYGLPICDPNEFDLGLVLSPKNFYVKFKQRF